MEDFVGRKEYLEALVRAMNDAFQLKHDVYRLAVIDGEPGSGKTYLLQRLAEVASIWVASSGEELRVGKGLCSDTIADSISFLPFFQVLDSFRSHPSRGRFPRLQQFDRLIAEIGPEWLRMIPVVGEGLAGTAHAVTRLREGQQLSHHFSPTKQIDTDIYRQYFEVISRLAQDHKLLVLLDDFQWADQESLNLLLYLGRQLYSSSLSVFVVCALRPSHGKLTGARIKPIDTVINLLGERKQCVQIHLNPFSREEVRKLLASYKDTNLTTPTQPIAKSEDFLESLGTLTGGNPLFLSELLHYLDEKGYLERTFEGVVLRHPLDLIPDLPISLEATIQERVDHLEENLKELLTTASVEGNIFTAQVLSQVRKRGLLEIIEMLSDALVQKHHLVEEIEEKQITYQKFVSLFSFRHGLIRQHLYRNLGTAQRRLLHKEIADSLEMLYGEDQIRPLASQLAKHYLIAREPLKITHYGLMAAREEYAKYAVTKALVWCDRVIEAAEQIPDPSPETRRSVVECLLLKAELHVHTGQDAMAEAILNLVEDDHGGMIQPFDRARIHLLRGEIYTVYGRLDNAISEYVKCQPFLQGEKQLTLKALALQRLGELSAISSRFDEARAYWMQGISQAKLANDILMEGMIWAEIAEFAIDEGDLLASDAATSQALPLLKSIKSKRGMATVLINVGFTDFIRGKMGRALANFHTAWTIFKEIEDVPNMIRTGHHIANCYLHKKKFLEAEAVLHELEQFCYVRQSPLSEVEYFISRCRLALSTEDYVNAIRYADNAIEIAVEGDHYSWPRAYAAKGAVLVKLQKYELAEHCFKVGLEHSMVSGYPYVQAILLHEYGVFLASRGREVEARALLTQAMQGYSKLDATSSVFDIQQLLATITSAKSS